MRLFLIDPHDQRLYGNGIFNITLYPNFYAWSKIKKRLLDENIILDTIDLHPIEKADRIFFLDHDFFSFKKDTISPYLASAIKKKIALDKRVLIIIECPIIKPESWEKRNHIYYGKIFTWNDSLVDNKKYFHYYWLQDTKKDKLRLIQLKKKKLAVLINAHKTNYLQNELYSQRIRAIRFFEKNAPQDFDLYGVGWGEPLNFKFVYSALKYGFLSVTFFLKDYLISLKGFPSYKGRVEDKIAILTQYKFCICFENMSNINGYITEKIFDCFKARCIPIYYGASNITGYIPSNTFIDFRQFKDFDEMYAYLKKMNEKTYNEYLSNIEKFLNSRQLKKWGYESYVDNVFLELEP